MYVRGYDNFVILSVCSFAAKLYDLVLSLAVAIAGGIREPLLIYDKA